MRFSRRELFFVPNLLTYLRVILIPIIYYALTRGQLPAAALLGGLAMLTDIFDGVLARKLNQNSELGKILDPLTDKIFIALFVIYVVRHRDFPVWAAALIISRDVLIITLGVIFSGRHKQIPVSNFLGKVTALSWGILLVVYVMEWENLKIPALGLSVALLSASVFSYANRFMSGMKEKRTPMVP